MTDTILQFTQSDRDMLRDTNSDVKRVLTMIQVHDKRADDLEARIGRLETWQARVLAVCGFVAFLLGLASRALWH